MSTPSCPICTFSVPSCSDQDVYFLMQHFELSHPENGTSPFIALEDASSPRMSIRSVRARMQESPPSGDEEDGEPYVDCPAQCGETVTLTELSSHMELHHAEDTAFGEAEAITKPGKLTSYEDLANQVNYNATTSDIDLEDSTNRTNVSRHQPRRRHRDHNGIKDWKDILLGSPSKKPRKSTTKLKHATPYRLGKSELGPHAYERQMPAWLFNQLERGAKVDVVRQIGPAGQIIRIEHVANETPGILPVLAQLCEQDHALKEVFLCHPGVKHVVKMPREGGFCGYRNIQMMVSYIQASKSPGHEHFPGRIPTILYLQDLIEAAWDKGINSAGRIETGGVKGTRKYIGTPEAQAVFIDLGIGCEANAFNPVDQTPVHCSLLINVLEYFQKGVVDSSQKVHRTSLPPLYFQHPGHSLTIVGLEICKNGAMTLLVLDPMFKTSPALCRFIGAKVRTHNPDRLLKAYRRGEKYLGKYDGFETLKLRPCLPPGDGW